MRYRVSTRDVDFEYEDGTLAGLPEGKNDTYSQKRRVEWFKTVNDAALKWQELCAPKEADSDE